MNNENLAETLKALRKPITEEQTKTRDGFRDRQGKVHQIEYVEWHTVADILDDNASDWSHSIKEVKEIGDIVTVTVAITICGITREGIGTGTANTETGIKKAEHDALKRAAVKFGVARELYRKESDIIEKTGSPSYQTEIYDLNDPPREALATNLNNTVTRNQLNLIERKAAENGVDADEFCQKYLGGVKLGDINRKAASWVINCIPQVNDKNGKSSPPDNVLTDNRLNPNRATAASVLGAKAKKEGELYFENKWIEWNGKAYDVKPWVNNKPLHFVVTKINQIVTCNCDEYKKVAPANPHFICGHKYAAELLKAKKQREKESVKS